MQIAEELAPLGAVVADFFGAAGRTIDSGKNLTPSRGTTRRQTIRADRCLGKGVL
jgi:hypothetical protein